MTGNLPETPPTDDAEDEPLVEEEEERRRGRGRFDRREAPRLRR